MKLTIVIIWSVMYKKNSENVRDILFDKNVMKGQESTLKKKVIMYAIGKGYDGADYSVSNIYPKV